MIYQWNSCRLDTRSYKLLYDDTEVAVEPQVFDLLAYLIENRDRVVPREELLDNLWNGRVVTDSALNARLKLVRKAVGDSGRTQTVIKTAHGRGYQFIAEVTCSSDYGASRNSRSGRADGSRNSGPSIAVVQFENNSLDPSQEYFADGMTHDIWFGLSRIPFLHVKSAFAPNCRNLSSDSIAAELGVDYVLAGSVQREGDRVRVFAELIEQESGETRWAERFDRQGSTVIDIQDDIASSIVATLGSFKGKIRELEYEQLSTKTAMDFSAFDFILKGMDAKEKYTREGNLEAHYYFDQAKALEPNNSEALGLNAMIHYLDSTMGLSDDAAHSLKQAYAEARRAIRADRNSVIGHWSLANCYCTDGEFERGLQEFDIAFEINPNDPDILVEKGGQMAISGAHDEGIAQILVGMEMNRLYPDWYKWNLGIAYFCAQRHDAAIQALSTMTEPNNETRIYLAASYALSKKPELAASVLQEIFVSDPDFSLERVSEAYRYHSETDYSNLQRGLSLAFQESTKSRVVHISPGKSL